MFKWIWITLAALCAFIVAEPGPASAGPPSSLTTNGRYVWQFEALLRDSFHSNHVSEHNLNFACSGACTPSAYWNTYLFTFATARNSSLHISAKTFRPRAFGSHPQPLKIRGKLVACDPQDHRFPIAYGDATGLGLDCLAPS